MVREKKEDIQGKRKYSSRSQDIWRRASKWFREGRSLYFSNRKLWVRMLFRRHIEKCGERDLYNPIMTQKAIVFRSISKNRVGLIWKYGDDSGIKRSKREEKYRGLQVRSYEAYLRDYIHSCLDTLVVLDWGYPGYLPIQSVYMWLNGVLGYPS